MSQALRSIKQKFINFFLMYINFAGRASYESIICVCVCVRERERERERESYTLSFTVARGRLMLLMRKCLCRMCSVNRLFL